MIMYRLLIVVFILISISGCSKPYPPLDTVKEVDLQKYVGTWYEIARYEHYFERGCRDVSATYTLKEDGDIKVVNRCTKEESEKKEAVGVAYAVDESNSKLKVSFFRPFYGDYWIIMLDDDYRYAVVGDPSREYLWILSRAPKLEENIKNKILRKLPEMGYSPEPLIWTPQGK
jgi:apolipoprotein D and lipocalin family protein